MLQRRVLHAGGLAGAGNYTPSFVGAESSSTTTINVASGAQPGDFALLFGSAPPLRSGWTQSYNQGILPFFEAHHTFLPDPVPSSYTFSVGAAELRLGILMIFRNVDSSNPLDVDPLVASPLVTTNTSPAVATSNERCLLVVGFGCYAGINISNIPGAPTGYSLASTQYDSAFDNYWFAAAYRAAPKIQTYTPTAWQDTSTGSDYSSSNMAAGTIALRGAPI